MITANLRLTMKLLRASLWSSSRTIGDRAGPLFIPFFLNHLWPSSSWRGSLPLAVPREVMAPILLPVRVVLKSRWPHAGLQRKRCSASGHRWEDGDGAAAVDDTTTPVWMSCRWESDWVFNVCALVGSVTGGVCVCVSSVFICVCVCAANPDVCSGWSLLVGNDYTWYRWLWRVCCVWGLPFLSAAESLSDGAHKKGR